jgi:CRISPR/Cas system CSM-associated protein Csm2 small subunit
LDEVIVLAAVRKALEGRRQEIAEKWPKRLSRSECHFTRGRHTEVEALAQVVQEAIRKANAADHKTEDDEDDADET